MKKGVSPLVSSVLLVAIVITGVTIVLNVGLPTLRESKENIVFQEAKSVLKSIDSSIKEIAYEPKGAARKLPIKFRDGELIVDKAKDEIRFTMETEKRLIPPGVYKKEGSLIISTGADVKAYENDVDSDNEDELVLENSRILFAVKKLGNESNYVPLNTKDLIEKMWIKEVNVNITPSDSSVLIDQDSESSEGTGYSKLYKKGNKLHDGEIKVFVKSDSQANYEIWYTLLAKSDFVQIQVKNVKYR